MTRIAWWIRTVCTRDPAYWPKDASERKRVSIDATCCEADPKGLFTEASRSEILRESQAVERGNHPRGSSAVGGLPHALQRRPCILRDGLELTHERLPLLFPLGL